MATAKKSAAKKGAGGIDAILSYAPTRKFSLKLKPMLATLVDKPFDSEDWIFEVKWDGYRALGFINKGAVDLKSRNDKSFNEKFYPVYDALTNWKINAVVDGEIVVIDESGKPTFGGLQNWRSEADGTLLYYLFDILWYEGKDLTELTLVERRQILKSIMPKDSTIRLSDDFALTGSEMFDAAKNMGLEGIMAKKKDSTYVQDRSKQWLKIKANKRHEVVIGGYTINDDTSKPFSSLLVGVYKNGKLTYTGKIGTGFDVKTQKDMMKRFKPLFTKINPFSEDIDINKPSRFRHNPPHATAYWLKPQLVCEVSYAEITSDGVMRHPSFEGMRTDKASKDVHEEKAQETKSTVRSKGASEPQLVIPKKNDRKTLLNPKDEAQVRNINGHELKFGNLSKIYWPKEGYTKRDLLNYYYQVAPIMLPYLKGRPHTLNRHPNGIEGETFYQKDITGKAPEWIETYLYHSEADNRDRHFLVGSDEASLLYMASIGCIEINPWSSTVDAPNNPTWCIIDLDPDKNTFNQVIEAAQVTKELLDSMKVPSYPKTSGSTGIHIYIPLGNKYSYEESKEFARLIATMVHQQIPKFTSIERMKSKRSGKMYIDFLQNRPQATIAAPYSVRPKPGATVSMPLQWEEVKKGLKMKDFTIFNAMERIKSVGDLFKPVLGKGIDMKKMLSKL